MCDISGLIYVVLTRGNKDCIAFLLWPEVAFQLSKHQEELFHKKIKDFTSRSQF
jgi:hypothetical protein